MHWKDNHFCWEKKTMFPYKHSSVTEHVHFYISISCFWKNNSFFSCFFFCCKTDDIIFWWTLSTITLNIFFLTKLPHFFFFCVDEEEEIYNLPRSLGSIRQWLLCTTEWFPPPCDISTYRIYMYCTVHKNKQTLDCAEDHEPDPSGFEILCCVGVYRKMVFKTVNYTPD